MRHVVSACLLVACACASASPVPGSAFVREAPVSGGLRARALQLSAADPAARPAGQCIFTCGERMVKYYRCANGECPEYDCRTGVAACPTR